MILITGCARSGTSLITGMIQACGAHLGAPADINALNENTAIRQEVLKPLLRELGGDPLGQSHFPPPGAGGLLPAWRVRDLRRDVNARLTDRPRAYKDAKLTVVFAAFHRAFPGARWVIVRRDREAIIDSCIRTPFMKHHGDSREGWGGWVDEHLRRFDAMQALGLNTLEVWPDRIIADPGAFAGAARHCGLQFSRAAVERRINPDRWHGVR